MITQLLVCMSKIPSHFTEEQRAERLRKNAERSKKWRESNPDYMKKYMKKWNEEHVEERRAADRAYHAANRERQNATRRQWALDNPEKQKAGQKRWAEENPEYLKDYRLKRKYGISLQDWNNMLVAQGGKCAIPSCTTPNGPGRASYVVDHDHKTGKVRAILCPSCNKLLGFARDQQQLLREAADYLSKHDEPLI